MNKARIFYVEDDETLAYLTTETLVAEGYMVDHYSNGQNGLQGFKRNQYDLCILDVMLPKIDGFELARRIRASNESIPIIFLSAKSMLDDKLEGLTLGADDYITKPFDTRELILKVDIFLNRRSKMGSPGDNKVVEFGEFVFDYANLILSHSGEDQTLTQKEADLLKYFCDHRGALIKRGEILEELWGRNDYFLGRSLDVFISRLRKYLSEDPKLHIDNIHGVGFKFIIDN
ncbi:MAG TPA: response regulator transcription factor [Saprospiraceae bacterium]|nr:response regulator transcription factor [Saprospiraceae bacterium]HQW56577.1 response regulator transcription factor [Saprospiraceae bacterium]